ncbi:MAG: TIGR01777 family oxidoreductase [bacterium]
MRILITGGTGFIGQQLQWPLSSQGHEVVILGRNVPTNNERFCRVDLTKELIPPEALKGVGAIIHLAGMPIFGKWTSKFKLDLYDNRITTTMNLVQSLKQVKKKPKTLISSSGVGFYGDRGDEELKENADSGDDFLSTLCQHWESEALNAENLGIRTVILRTAPVLGNQGVIQQLLPLFRAGFGGKLSNGRQWFPWVYQDDVIRGYLFALEKTRLQGVINLSSPTPVKNKDFTKLMAKVLRRPAWLTIPKFALRWNYGELADSIIASQRVIPEKIEKAKFSFEYSELESALSKLL